jgi:hypothetical protein
MALKTANVGQLELHGSASDVAHRQQRIAVPGYGVAGDLFAKLIGIG